MNFLIDILADAFLDTAKLLPFLFLTYLAMEYLENRAEQKTVRMLSHTGGKGPVIGGLLGVVPQCGFSSAAASLYSGGVISAGTLIAVFLSTSDEMLPILLTGRAGLPLIAKILVLKAGLGILFGLLLDAALLRLKPNVRKRSIHQLCEQDHCHCEEGSILRSALTHTLQVAFFIFLVSLALGCLVELIGMDRLIPAMQAQPVFSVFAAALVGLIPNCASSVAITTFYLQGMLPFGSMFAGLLSCAGVGLIVLFRTNRSLKVNLGLVAVLYAVSVFCGVVCGLFF